jgi:hypothetical protein
MKVGLGQNPVKQEGICLVLKVKGDAILFRLMFSHLYISSSMFYFRDNEHSQYVQTHHLKTLSTTHSVSIRSLYITT